MTIQASPSAYVSFEDFLVAERAGDLKHEWLDGVVYAMAGGSIEHGRLATKMTTALTVALSGECTVYSSDVMLYGRETSLATYPDGTVVCGAVDVQKGVRNGKALGEAITNPTLVFEVLSEDSTEGYDRGEKFAHYMRLPSLEEYVLVTQTERRIEIYRKPQGGRGHWHCDVAREGDTFAMHQRTFRLDDIYDR